MVGCLLYKQKFNLPKVWIKLITRICTEYFFFYKSYCFLQVVLTPSVTPSSAVSLYTKSCPEAAVLIGLLHFFSELADLTLYYSCLALNFARHPKFSLLPYSRTRKSTISALASVYIFYLNFSLIIVCIYNNVVYPLLLDSRIRPS